MPESSQNWIGVDLDGTLAEFHEEEYFGKYGPETIGKPIPKMVKRIKSWVTTGAKVKIFTARIAELTACLLESTVELMEDAIHVWLIKNLGFDLEVTNEKDCFMIELWDDIDLVQVERNTGKSKLSAQDRFMNIRTRNQEGIVFLGGTGSYRYCNNFPIKIKEEKISNFNLEIRPAIPVELRHKISELIEKEGYNVWGQGEFLDKSACDICFDSSDEPKREMHGIEAKEGEINEVS